MYHVFFGTKKNAIEPDTIRGQELTAHNGIWPITPLIFQHQVHKTHGCAVTAKTINQYKKVLTHDSDYLVTNMTGIGIGVLTADCLPIALYDPINRAIGIVHAGWRGSIGKIIASCIKHMNTCYQTQPYNLKIHFGPCAHACCYQVDNRFVNQLPKWAHAAIITQNNQLFFDLTLCNTIILLSSGVHKDSIDQTTSQCTMCTDQFCSYRINPGITTRQMSIIWLH